MNAQITRPDLESNNDNDSESPKESILQKQKEPPWDGLIIENLAKEKSKIKEIII